MNRGTAKQDSFIFGAVSIVDLSYGSERWSVNRSNGKFSVLSSSGESKIQISHIKYPEVFLKHSRSFSALGYNSHSTVGSYSGEFLNISIDHSNHLLKIETDSFAAIPLYYCLQRDKVYISSDFVSLVPYVRRPIELNTPALAEFLLLKSLYGPETILSDIKLLPAHSSLIWYSNGELRTVNNIQTKSYFCGKTSRIRSDDYYVNSLAGLLNDVTKAIISQSGKSRIGSELSGGVDSSIVSQVLGRCCPSKLETFSLILPGIDGRNQVLRLGKFKNRFKCNLNFILAESFYPFKDIVENGITEPFDPLIEPYRDSFSRLIELAKAKSINIMFNGVGGDELLSLRGGVNLDIELDSEVSDRREKDIPNYFPADLKNALLDEEHIMNNLLVSSYTGVASSIYRANLATNSLFINKGIWCVAPLANPAIVDFCYNLPSRLRRNYKKLLYLYQYKYSFPRSFYPGKHKDTFTPLLLSALRGKASNLLTELFSESLLAKYGFLNRSKLIRAYLDFINRKIFPEHSDSFYEIAVLEIFLRSMIS